MQITQKNNRNSLTPKNTHRPPPLNPEMYNQIYDVEFVSLINNLNESIKEYYKVSKNNINEANSILLSYEQQAQDILNLMQHIINTSSNEKLEVLFGQIPKVLEVITQMKINASSNNNNLNMFFDDAKILFKNMKSKRKEKLNEINNINNQYIQTSSDSYANSFNLDKENIRNKIVGNNKIVKPINADNNSNDAIFNNINMIYTRILKMLNNFNEFNYMISKVNIEESNKFNNLQNGVKKEFENLYYFLKKNLGKMTNKSLIQNKSCTNLNEQGINPRSKSIQSNRGNIEKLKQLNETYKNKINELNNILIGYKSKTRELEIKNNNLRMQLKNAEQLKMNFPNNMNQNNLINNNLGFNNIIKQKDLQIKNLTRQLHIFQTNESSLNVQINNIQAQLKQKISQYEYQISNMSQIIASNKTTIATLQNNLNIKQSELEKYQKSMEGKNNYDIDKNMEMLNMELKEKQSKINVLNEEIKNYQRKDDINQKQIEEMNNNILNYENIIKQKDELINNNYKDNNEVFKIKLENEKLKKQIEELKNSNNNNYLIQNQKMINGNINSYEAPEIRNQEYITKINDLTQEIQNLKQNLSLINEEKTKLQIDMNKKNDELDGYKQVIFKLQNKLEQNNDKEEELKKRLNTEKNMSGHKTETSIRDNNQNSKNLNKSFEMPKDNNTQLMNKFLGQLNEAEKKISLLQNKNKELQWKLDEKQVEKDFSGYRTEDYNFSNYQEEFDLKKMVNGAREKNRSEDINIDYPGVQTVKDKYKELLQNMHLLEEQVKILICNISITSKIKPQISQICQLMRIKAENIQAIIAGKDKKRMLGLVS